MATKAEIREASLCAEQILSGILNAGCAASMWEQNQEPEYARRFVHALYEIEDAHSPWRESAYKVTRDAQEAFAAVNQHPVSVSGVPCASAHDAIFHLAIDVTGIAYDVVKAAIPDYCMPGVEQLCPPLPAEDDMIAHVGVAIASFRRSFPSADAANTLQALRLQELARAVSTAEGPDAEPVRKSKGYAPRGKDQKAIVALLEQGERDNKVIEEKTWASPETVRQTKMQWLQSRYGS
jgi:hypothetical protein